MTNEKLSEVKVLQSAAGYYIGRLYWDEDCKAWLPYDRLSGYYASEVIAAEDKWFYDNSGLECD